jgi:hypothetical protein
MMNKEVMKRSQPMCFSGWIIHWKRNLLGKPVEQNESMTVDYVAMKQQSVVRDVVKDYFKDKGVDVDALVENRKNNIDMIRAGFTLV